MKKAINFEKGNGLVPVIIQHALTNQVLMLGYMNQEAYDLTLAKGLVTFYSRSRAQLWTKGDTSGNYLKLVDVAIDCDQDALLIKALPGEGTCHTGQFSCFESKADKGFIYELEQTIEDKIEANEAHSYTNALFQLGINKIAQKVGEEAVELVIEAKDDNIDLFKGEAADLLYHFLILLKYKNLKLSYIEAILYERSKL